MSTLTVGQLQEIIAGLGAIETNLVTYDGVLRGKTGSQSLFTVSGGIVAFKILPRVTVDLISSGNGTIEIGSSSSTAKYIAQTLATALDQDEIWNDASPDSAGELTTSTPFFYTAKDITETIGTGDITAGAVSYVVMWYPITVGATLSATVKVSSPSPSLSASPSLSLSPSASRSPSASLSPSSSVSSSVSASISPSSSASRSQSPSASTSPSASVSPSSSASSSSSPSASPSVSQSPSSSVSPSGSASPSII